MVKFFIKIFILILFLSESAGIAEEVSPDNTTEIIIVGTVHKSTFNFDSDTLLNILHSTEPDVVLVECDSTYMTPDYKLNDNIKYSFPETQAITEYSKNKYVELRPYDIPGRDNFLNRRERRRSERNFFRDIYSLSREDKFNDQGIEILNKILSMMSIAEEMANAKASYINNTEGSWKIDTINYYSYEGLGSLINTTPELLEYKEYWEEEYSYWIKRNDVMLENILKYSKQFKGKRIVVLCGFAHKNYLKNNLNAKALHEELSIKEFYDF